MGKLIIYHSGNVLPEDVETITQRIENSLSEENKNTTKKIIFLTVETLQNIIHHSDKDSSDNTFAYFELIKEHDFYLMKSGNLITNENTKTLSDRLHCIMRMDEEKINESIRTNLVDCEFSEKGGAGIGLLSVQKKTKKGLNFEVEYFKGDYNFIHFEIKI